MKTATLTTRIDPALKAEAEATAAPLGITLSQAVNIFIHRFVACGGIPFEVSQPRYNADTGAAIAEGKAIAAGRMPAKTYSSFGELITDLDE
ncbi:MAG: type II toxin-antitoxin system RelB/DinJ family antitoxin [Propionibacteriaceae bacterium]|jgi:DNA-damage-inducible protein J|nr:type II toxin-antitoxin system RelB/DinJ family antitoxin [Propionibacteriaceae bacterium]